MKVGILTWHDVLNYGSALQAYALQEQIKSLGNNVEILRHDRTMPDYFGNNIPDLSLKTVLRWLRNQTPNRRRYRRETECKYTNFMEFHKNYLQIGNHFSHTDADSVVIGSDQIFDIDYFYFPFQFGQGVSCSKISAYAPSFGETRTNSFNVSPHRQEIEANLHKMAVVTARDINTKGILDKVLGKDTPLVLDPALFYSFDKEKKLWNKRLVAEKYCLVYSWGGFTTGELFANECKAFARRHGLRLVSVGERRTWCDIQFASASPVEFFELFMHADMVLTNMFHGTCFSLVHERPFYSFAMPHNYNKLAGLLQDLELPHNILTRPEDLQSLSIPEMDYIQINNRINAKKERSLAALKNMLI